MSNEIRGFSLCSGGGGLDVAMQAIGVQTVGYCELETYAQAILHARMRDGWLDSAPIYPDLKALTGAAVLARCGRPDFVYGGIPCQPHSTASQSRKGADDPRDLWPDTYRLLRELRPGGFLLENVAGFSTQRGGDPAFAWHVISDLTALGYHVRWTHVLAGDAGAPHQRRRFFLLAVPDAERDPAWGGRHDVEGTTSEAQNEGIQRQRVRPIARNEGVIMGNTESNGRSEGDWGSGDAQPQAQLGTGLPGRAERVMGDSASEGRPTPGGATVGTETRGRARLHAARASRGAFPPGPTGEWQGVPEQLWPALESGVHGVADGLATGVDGHRRRRLETLGNGVVPHAAVLALAELLGVSLN